eukprot:CAMPEP_0185571042 /NCGR_PEP_ID=MMETSP0434-20130131/3116_1 /TAXON_ID=626734 ORGANISM="Favella taraikaensis, Strain Fe Narragansett Bay" /NCGR_SAMPLE_ID=MMETSP0434 /ASSEMBLY_ACC=CAM_ASM_000379 /LENGTH=74 /DNA_ID=CAMNT_0028186285 /DNA_START=612 /DNA_END=836 /DNA_ORIENTATION=+
MVLVAIWVPLFASLHHFGHVRDHEHAVGHATHSKTYKHRHKIHRFKKWPDQQSADADQNQADKHSNSVRHPLGN